MNTKTYNGWTNYQTWNVKLWMDNDQGSYEYWSEQANEALQNAEADHTFTKEERAKLDLMHALKDSFQEQEADMLKSSHLSASMWADLLGAALSEVNWHEIASSLIDDALERNPIQTEEPQP